MSLKIERIGHCTVTRLQRPPNNFLDAELLAELADALEEADRDDNCRVAVIASDGKHFSAGANLVRRLDDNITGHIYQAAARLVRTRKPIIAAVQGAAIGAGLGLAMIADFRIGCSESRLSANFARQGYHPGFGLTFTLPRIAGAQNAAWLLYSGERVNGEKALAMGLLDRLAPRETLLEHALRMAQELASSGPLAVQATRETLRADFAVEFDAAIHSEMAKQDVLRKTEDYAEGVRAMSERRLPVFTGQ